MSDQRRSEHDGLTRRNLLRLGLLAVSATGSSITVVPGASAQEAKLGANLIGKLEGAEVVTDPAKFPKSFKEAPQLAELVKAGKLPPVEERIGQDPLVVRPLREIGKYGGTWRRGFTGPFDTSNGHRVAQNDKLLYWDYTGTKLVPNIARAWDVSRDGKVTTILLRRGMKWSDGQPFTADDFVFWFEDCYENKDLIPTPLSVMMINGKPIALKKIDASTVQFVSPEPYYALPTVLASVWGIGHHARFGRFALGGFAPAHYMKQFHPKHTWRRISSTERPPSSSSNRGSPCSRPATTPAAIPTCPSSRRGRRPRRSTRRRGSSSATRTACGSTPTATSCPTSTASG